MFNIHLSRHVGIHAPLSTLLSLYLLSPPVCRSMQVTTITQLWVLEMSIYSLIAYTHLSHGTPLFAHVRSFRESHIVPYLGRTSRVPVRIPPGPT
jgi:hypothetical protein